jgi:hypothetical protein
VPKVNLSVNLSAPDSSRLWLLPLLKSGSVAYLSTTEEGAFKPKVPFAYRSGLQCRRPSEANV